MDKVQKINAKFYDKNHLAWAAAKTNSFYQEVPFRKFIKHLKPGNSVLDIGCAYGIHVPLFLGIGHKLKYSGLDISNGMLGLARSRYPQLNFKQGNVLEMETLPKTKFDAFWAAAVLMHIPIKEWDIMLGNIESITKSSAIGYITVPKNRPNPESNKDSRHFTLFNNKNKFIDIVSKSNWQILESGWLASSNRTTKWFWYVVKLPKK